MLYDTMEELRGDSYVLNKIKANLEPLERIALALETLVDTQNMAIINALEKSPEELTDFNDWGH